jgi:hypothetical protein
MMSIIPDYSYDSLFNPDKSFARVRLAGDCPVPEQFLHEAHDIAAYIRETTMSLVLPSGVARKGAHKGGDEVALPDYCFTAGAMLAVVKGFPFRIMGNAGNADNLVTLPSTGSLRNYVFLELWKEEVDENSSLYKYGGEESGTVINDLIDVRIGVGTSRRVQFRWRIRTESSTSEMFPSTVKARGAKAAVTDLTFVQDLYDAGLYVAGTGSTAHKTTLGTVDGYSYALPLFKVVRTDSGGLNKVISTSSITPIFATASGSTLSPSAISTLKAGGSNVTATAQRETVEIQGGTGITVSGDPENKTVTITATGGVSPAEHGGGHIEGGADPIPAATTSLSGLMSATDKTKLNGMPANVAASDHTHTPASIGAATDTHGHTAADVGAAPESHVGSGGGTHAVATISAAGFMSATDKTKLNAIESGAQVNQNAFGKAKAGGTTITAFSTTDTVEFLGGAGITVTGNATNKTVTITASVSDYAQAVATVNGKRAGYAVYAP